MLINGTFLFEENKTSYKWHRHFDQQKKKNNSKRKLNAKTVYKFRAKVRTRVLEYNPNQSSFGAHFFVEDGNSDVSARAPAHFRPITRWI